MNGEHNEEITLYHLKPGEQCIINTSSLMAQSEAVGTAVSFTDIKGYLLDEKSVKELLVKSSAYQEFVFSLFSVRLSSLAILIEDIKFKRLDKRLFEWLDSRESKITITHEQIADELGTSRVVISRLLKDLERKGLIQLARGQIIKLF